jgi:hypothetical protein
MACEKFKEAIDIIDEIKERYYDSLKLANLKVSCLINLN